MRLFDNKAVVDVIAHETIDNRENDAGDTLPTPDRDTAAIKSVTHGPRQRRVPRPKGGRNLHSVDSAISSAKSSCIHCEADRGQIERDVVMSKSQAGCGTRHHCSRGFTKTGRKVEDIFPCSKHETQRIVAAHFIEGAEHDLVLANETLASKTLRLTAVDRECRGLTSGHGITQLDREAAASYIGDAASQFGDPGIAVTHLAQSLAITVVCICSAPFER